MYFFPSTWKQNLEFPRCKCPIERTHFLSSSRVFSSLLPSLSFFLRHSPRFSRRKKQTSLASKPVHESAKLTSFPGISAYLLPLLTNIPPASTFLAVTVMGMLDRAVNRAIVRLGNGLSSQRRCSRSRTSREFVENDKV